MEIGLVFGNETTKNISHFKNKEAHKKCSIKIKSTLWSSLIISLIILNQKMFQFSLVYIFIKKCKSNVFKKWNFNNL